MPRVVATTASGQPILANDYLKQTKKTPFQVGRVLPVGTGNWIYGYSGMVDLGPHAGLYEPLIDFQLARSAILKFKFSADYSVAANNAVGFQITVGSELVYKINCGDNANPGWIGLAPGGLPEPTLIIPENRAVKVEVINANMMGGIALQANVTIIGNYI